MTFLGGGDVGDGGNASALSGSVTVVVVVAIVVEVKEQRECQRKKGVMYSKFAGPDQGSALQLECTDFFPEARVK